MKNIEFYVQAMESAILYKPTQWIPVKRCYYHFLYREIDSWLNFLSWFGVRHRDLSLF